MIPRDTAAPRTAVGLTVVVFQGWVRGLTNIDIERTLKRQNWRIENTRLVGATSVESKNVLKYTRIYQYLYANINGI